VTSQPLPEHLRSTHARLQGLLDTAIADQDLPSEAAHAVLQEMLAALEELRVAEEELTAQSEQLAASSATIDEERERFVELFEFAPDAYFETDELGKIVEANHAASALLGIAPRPLTGKLLVTFVDTDDRRVFRRLLARALAGEAVDETQVRLVTRDGRAIDVGITVARQERPSLTSTQLRWLVRDITERLTLQGQVDDLAGEVELLVRAAEVQRLVAGEDPLAITLRGLAELAQDLLPGCQVGMTLLGRSDMERSMSAGERARELDARQRAAGEGPCIETASSATMVRGRPGDWPVLADAHDVVEIVAVPIIDADEVAGALNVYAMDHPVDARELRLLGVLVRQASVALDNATLYVASANLARGLTSALETRGVIERAKGILMAREAMDDDAAFEVLKRASQRENVKLHDIAARIVESVLTPD